MIEKNITLEQALEIAKPYDEGSHSISAFKRVLYLNPSLKRSFREQLTDEFCQAANERGLYFMTTMVRSKNFEAKIYLTYVGPEEAPAISLYYPRKYW